MKQSGDDLKKGFGARQRVESNKETVRNGREVFNGCIQRYQAEKNRKVREASQGLAGRWQE